MTRRLDLAILILAVGGGYFALTPATPREEPVIPAALSGTGEPDRTLRGAPPDPDVAQLVERPSDTGQVAGSTPAVGVKGGAPLTVGRRPVRKESIAPTPSNSRRPVIGAPTARRKPVAAPRVAQRPVTAAGHVLRGTATFYGTGGPGSYGAMHEYADGSRVVVVVTAFHDGRTWSVTIPVVTQCGACRWQSGGILVDLSLAAWDQLGWPRSRGVIPVQVQIVEGALGS